MLRIHKPFSKSKLLNLIITSICITSGLLGISILTYTPELSHAETVSSKKTLADIEYMQEVTADICTNTPEADTEGNYQYQLKDSRDQKTYWVAKLKDGNCWMTQNLDLDITTEGLKASDTDILEDWNAATNPDYPPVATQTDLTNQSTNIFTSYDPGIKLCTESGKVCTEPTTSNYDRHFLQGNIYAFNTVIAGKASTITRGENISIDNSSICPKGWKLPLAGLSQPNTDDPRLIIRDGSFAYLLESYGWQWNNRYYTNNLTGDTGYNILRPPFYYVYSGYVYNNSMEGMGTNGRYWSRMTYYGSPFALSTNTDVKPSLMINTPLNFSVRCMMLGGVDVNNNMNITINPTISIDVTDEINVEKSDINPSTAAFSALVASNQPYSVSISSNSPNMTSSTSDVAIPSKSGTLTSSENAWGIKLSTTSTYEQITTTPKLFYSSTSPESKPLPFTIGISTSPDIPNGEYSTNITITATQN